MSCTDGERVIAVGGAKGGVGKTTSSLNIAAAMASAKCDVVVIEFDLAMANILDFLDIGASADGEVTFHDVLAGDASVLDAVYATAWGFDVIPSGTSIDGYAKVDLDQAAEILSWLRNLYDVVLLDTPAGLSRETVRPFQLADEVLLVSTPRASAIRNAANTIELAERVGTPVAGLVLTKSGTGKSPGGERIAEFLGLDLLGHVPDDDAVPHSQDSGEPVLEHAPRAGPAIAYRRIAGALLDADIPAPGSGSAEPQTERAVEATEDGPAATEEGASAPKQKLADGSGKSESVEDQPSRAAETTETGDAIRARASTRGPPTDDTGTASNVEATRANGDGTAAMAEETTAKDSGTTTTDRKRAGKDEGTSAKENETTEKGSETAEKGSETTEKGSETTAIKSNAASDENETTALESEKTAKDSKTTNGTESAQTGRPPGDSTDSEDGASGPKRTAQPESSDSERNDQGERGSDAASEEAQSAGSERHLRGKVTSWLGR